MPWGRLAEFRSVFDGIFDGDDFLIGQIDAFEGGIEGGGFAAAGGAGDEEDAVGEAGEMLHALQHVVVEAEAAEVVEIAGGAIEEAHDDALAVEGGQGGNAEVDFAADDFDLDAAILGEAALGNIELGHELEAADDGGLELAGRRLLIEEHAIDAEADAEFLFEGLDVNIAGAGLDEIGRAQV